MGRRAGGVWKGAVCHAVAAGRRSRRRTLVPTLAPTQNPLSPVFSSVSRFSGVHTLDLHFPGDGGGGLTRIDFVGLKGTHTPVCGRTNKGGDGWGWAMGGRGWAGLVGASGASRRAGSPAPPSRRLAPHHHSLQPPQAKREAVVAVYEARPVPGDHKAGGRGWERGSTVRAWRQTQRLPRLCQLAAASPLRQPPTAHRSPPNHRFPTP